MEEIGTKPRRRVEGESLVPNAREFGDDGAEETRKSC